MAIERKPEFTNEELHRRSAQQFDNELQADPELAEGPASGGRIAMYAIALVAILGVVFYGLNTSSTSPDATPTAQTTPASPSGTAQIPQARAGQTTGSSMRQPAPPPAASPSGGDSIPTAPQNNSAPTAPSSN